MIEIAAHVFSVADIIVIHGDEDMMFYRNCADKIRSGLQLRLDVENEMQGEYRP